MGIVNSDAKVEGLPGPHVGGDGPNHSDQEAFSIHGKQFYNPIPVLVKYSVCMSVCLILVYIAYVYSFYGCCPELCIYVICFSLYLCILVTRINYLEKIILKV